VTKESSGAKGEEPVGGEDQGKGDEGAGEAADALAEGKVLGEKPKSNQDDSEESGGDEEIAESQHRGASLRRADEGVRPHVVRAGVHAFGRSAGH